MNIITKLRQINLVLNNINQVRFNEDIYCLHLINRIMHNGNYLPFSNMSIRPFVLAFLMNEIIVNERRSIIEFGAGVSTIMMARLAKMNNIQLDIVSVEEDESWMNIVKGILDREGLSANIVLIHVPLEKKILQGFENHWYQMDILKRKLGPSKTFDLVLIDGPTACHKQIALSRYFALPFLKDALREKHIIFLDDANRIGEQQIMELWKQELGTHFKIFAETLGICYVGENYESNPLKTVSIQ